MLNRRKFYFLGITYGISLFALSDMDWPHSLALYCIGLEFLFLAYLRFFLYQMRFKVGLESMHPLLRLYTYGFFSIYLHSYALLIVLQVLLKHESFSQKCTSVQRKFKSVMRYVQLLETQQDEAFIKAIFDNADPSLFMIASYPQVQMLLQPMLDIITWFQPYKAYIMDHLYPKPGKVNPVEAVFRNEMLRMKLDDIKQQIDIANESPFSVLKSWSATGLEGKRHPFLDFELQCHLISIPCSRPIICQHSKLLLAMCEQDLLCTSLDIQPMIRDAKTRLKLQWDEQLSTHVVCALMEILNGAPIKLPPPPSITLKSHAEWRPFLLLYDLCFYLDIVHMPLYLKQVRVFIDRFDLWRLDIKVLIHLICNPSNNALLALMPEIARDHDILHQLWAQNANLKHFFMFGATDETALGFQKRLTTSPLQVYLQHMVPDSWGSSKPDPELHTCSIKISCYDFVQSRVCEVGPYLSKLTPQWFMDTIREWQSIPNKCQDELSSFILFSRTSPNTPSTISLPATPN